MRSLLRSASRTRPYHRMKNISGLRGWPFCPSSLCRRHGSAGTQLVREPHRDEVARHDDRVGRRSDRRRPDAARFQAVDRSAGVLPRRCRDAAGGQVRGMAAARHMERQVPGRRQRRQRRNDQLRGDGHCADAWLRHREHRYRPPDRECPRWCVGDRASGAGRGLRLSRDSRDGRNGKRSWTRSTRSRRHSYCGVFHGRSPGAHGGAALSGGLRRHHRGCAGRELVALPDRRAHVGGGCIEQRS